MSTQPSIDYDPFQQKDAVPHGLFATMRAQCPVAKIPVGWFLAKQADVLTATKDVETFVASFPRARGRRSRGREVHQRDR